MLQVQRLSKSYGTKTVLANVNFIVNDREHVGLVGSNGTGKSTLLRCIVGGEQPDAGTIVVAPPGATFGYFAQTFDLLDDRTVGKVIAAAQADLTHAATALEGATEALATSANLDDASAVYSAALVRFEALDGYEREHHTAAIVHGLGMTETNARNFLHLFLFAGESVFRRVGDCSVGERKRLQLALLVRRGWNLLLDEPLNHLDIEGREHFAAALDTFEGTVIAVIHDRAFLRAFAARTIEVRIFEGSYDEYLRQRSNVHATPNSEPTA